MASDWQPAWRTSVTSKPLEGWFGHRPREPISLCSSPRYFYSVLQPYHGTLLHLDLVAIGLILLHQCFLGKLGIQYDRLILVFVAAIGRNLFIVAILKASVYLRFMAFISFSR
jgi:hypothetical protein